MDINSVADLDEQADWVRIRLAKPLDACSKGKACMCIEESEMVFWYPQMQVMAIRYTLRRFHRAIRALEEHFAAEADDAHAADALKAPAAAA